MSWRRRGTRNEVRRVFGRKKARERGRQNGNEDTDLGDGIRMKLDRWRSEIPVPRPGFLRGKDASGRRRERESQDAKERRNG